MVKIIYRNTEWEVPGKATIKEVIAGLGLNPETILAVSEGKLVNIDTRLGTQGEIRLISVVSGG